MPPPCRYLPWQVFKQHDGACIPGLPGGAVILVTARTTTRLAGKDSVDSGTLPASSPGGACQSSAFERVASLMAVARSETALSSVVRASVVAREWRLLRLGLPGMR